jgi:hypothetical protein
MSAATITQAQDKALRQQFVTFVDGLRGLALSLLAVRGAYTPPGLTALAAQAQSHSPSLANELRNFASRG